MPQHAGLFQDYLVVYNNSSTRALLAHYYNYNIGCTPGPAGMGTWPWAGTPGTAGLPDCIILPGTVVVVEKKLQKNTKPANTLINKIFIYIHTCIWHTVYAYTYYIYI